MNLPARVDVTATFRDASQPRPLADRLLAVAHRHARGWTLNIPEHDTAQQHMTFDSIPDAVSIATGVGCLLIVWPGREAS